jgi:hypothetical protein
VLGCRDKGFPIISEREESFVRTSTPQYVITDYDFEHDIATVEELKDGDETKFFRTHPGKFKYCFVTYLLKKHQRDITYRYWYKDSIKKEFLFGFQKLPSSTDEYEESTDVALSRLYKNGLLGFLSDLNSPPDIYISLFDKDHHCIAVTNEVREPGDFTYPGCSLVVHRSPLGMFGQDFYDGKKWIGYKVETVIKGEMSKSSFFNRSRVWIYVWMTRHGFDLYIGNTKEEAESGLGIFGFTMPHYWYPQLQEGQTIQAKIIAYEVV